ncbi:MAG: molybdate ABC transporter permease subunit [Armatimonadetes bacterium]|nr:molybdate ABC transporter permease subunit [Armatimonadota bacterium]
MTAPLLLSLRVALFSLLLVVATGLPVAYFTARRARRSRKPLEGLILLPLTLPPTVLGYYLLTLFSPDTAFGTAYRALFGSDLVFSWQGAVLAASLGSWPLFVRQAQTALQAISHELEEVSWNLGATKWQTFRHVLLPLALPGVLAGVGLALARSLGDFGATLMVAGSIPGRTQTLSLAIYEAVMSNDRAAAAWMSLVLAGIGASAAIFVVLLAGRRLETRPDAP